MIDQGKHMRRLWVPLAMVLALSGCMGMEKAAMPDAVTGMYETRFDLTSTNVTEVGVFNPEAKRMIYLRENPSYEPSIWNRRFSAQLEKAFREMGLGDRLVTKDSLQQLIIERNLNSRVPSVADIEGLHKLGQAVGAFLVVEPSATRVGPYGLNASLTIVDAGTGKTVLLTWFEKPANNLSIAAFDEPVFRPLINGMIRWMRQEPVTPTP